ncbi:MAG: hypothetical protein U0V64_10620 [Cyclobacteriaceae bacterium]
MHKNSRIILAISALALVVTIFVPLWRILMWAPQYPEWLSLQIWIDNITGDLRTINALNHYIGMKQIQVSMFPEFAFLKYLVLILTVVGLAGPVFNSRRMVLGWMLLLVLAGAGALVDFYRWGYDYGHNLDPSAPIKVPGMAYQPPILGTKQLLNFTAFSGPDVGGWIFVAVGAITAILLVWEFRFRKI